MPHNITDSAWTGPDLKPEEEKRAAQKTLAVLEEMADVFKKAGEDTKNKLHWITDLGRLDAGTNRFLKQTLGRGEVKISLCGGEAVAEETEIPAVWRLTIGEQTSLVAALLPRCVTTLLETGNTDIKEPEKKPDGLFAAGPVLSELRQALKDADLTKIPELPDHQIDLSRQPLNPADMNYILTTLGEGKVDIELSGFAKSRIQASRVKGIWRSRILNNAGKTLMDSLVVALIPPEVPAGREDIPTSEAKLRELADWIRRDMARGAIG